MPRNTRLDTLRSLYEQLAIGRYSPEVRGALWTLIVFRDTPITLEAFESILGVHWINLINQITRAGLGKLHKQEDGSHIFVPSFD